MLLERMNALVKGHGDELTVSDGNFRSFRSSSPTWLQSVTA